MKKNIVRHSFSIGIALVVALAGAREFLLPGVPQTHDSQYHLGRVAGYFAAVKDGHIPPRWGGELNLGFGYPVFNFNYPMGNIIGLGYLAIGLSVEAAFKLIYLTAYLAGGLGYYLWLTRYFRRSVSLFGTIVFLFTPFQFLNMFVRGAFGEVVSIGLLPWVFLAIDLIAINPGVRNIVFGSIAGGMWLLSHNVSVLIMTPVVGLYGMTSLIKNPNHIPGVWFGANQQSIRQNLLRIGALGMTAILGIFLSLWFWIPALAEKRYTILETIPSNVSYQDHYPTLLQLLWGKWGYGLSAPGPRDGMSFAIGELQIILFAIGTMLFLGILRGRQFKLNPISRTECVFLFTIAVSWAAILFMNQATIPIARLIPGFQYIQHPWRLLQVTTLMLGFSGAFVMSRVKKTLPLWILLAGFMVYSLPRTVASGRFTNPDLFYLRFPLTTSGEEENLPIWFDQVKNYKQKEQVSFLEPNVIHEIDVWKTTRHVYRVNVPKNSRAVEHTSYFPGWRLLVDGKPAPIDYQYKDYPGLITYALIKGDHTITTEFRNTPVRLLGNGISVFAAVVLCVLWFWPKRAGVARALQGILDKLRFRRFARR